MPRAGGPEFAADVAAFEQAFADQPDLAHLTGPARRLLTVSAALFSRSGAAATSVRDITRACGLSPGALYNHFGSKDDLLDTIVRHGHDRLEQRIRAALGQAAGGDGDTPPDVRAAAAFVRAYILGHLEHPELAQLVRREYLHLSPDRRRAVVRRRRQLRERLALLLQGGQAAGHFDLIGGMAGATRVAIMVLDMCSRTSEWYDPSRPTPADELAEQYVTAALRLAGAHTP